MKLIFNKSTEEFVARVYCDLGKNILSIGFATYFFKDLALPFRFGIGMLGVGLIIWSVYLIERKGE